MLTMSVPRLTRYFDLGVSNEIHNLVKIKVIPFPTPVKVASFVRPWSKLPLGWRVVRY